MTPDRHRLRRLALAGAVAAVFVSLQWRGREPDWPAPSRHAESRKTQRGAKGDIQGAQLLATVEPDCAGPFRVFDESGELLAAFVEDVPADGVSLVERQCGVDMAQSFRVRLESGERLIWFSEVHGSEVLDVVLPRESTAEVVVLGLRGQVEIPRSKVLVTRLDDAHFQVRGRVGAAQLPVLGDGKEAWIWVPLDGGVHTYDLSTAEGVAEVLVTCEPGPCPETLLCHKDGCKRRGEREYLCACPAEAASILAVDDGFPIEVALREPEVEEMLIEWPLRDLLRDVPVRARWTGPLPCTYSVKRMDSFANLRSHGRCNADGGIATEVRGGEGAWKLQIEGAEGTYRLEEVLVDASARRVDLGLLSPATGEVSGRVYGFPWETAGSWQIHAIDAGSVTPAENGEVVIRGVEPGAHGEIRLFTSLMGTWSASGWMDEGFQWTARPEMASPSASEYPQ